MTQERFEALEPFSGHLYTAAYCSFIRLTDNKAKAVLEKLYLEEFGNSGNILGGCNRCVLNALKKLGLAYFKYKKELQEKPDIVGEELEPKTEVIENKPVAKPKTKKAATKSKKSEKK